MAEYRDEYAITFEKALSELNLDKKMKEMLKKAISFILEKPYVKAEGLEEYNNKLFRKNVCAGRLRVFYGINQAQKIIRFHIIKFKNKNTYKT